MTAIFRSRMNLDFPRLSFVFASLMIATVMTHGESIRPLRFGPFLQQAVTFEGSPVGYGYLPPTGSYNFKAGWMEPINIRAGDIFHGTYLETQGNATLSPYQSDLEVVFNLKPIRFLEGGLAYNRLLFPGSMLGFNRPVGAALDWTPTSSEWRTGKVFNSRVREAVGADVFTFHGNLILDVGRVQLLMGAFRSLWDVNTENKDILLEYNSGLLIQKNDRINSLYAQTLLALNPYLAGWGFTAQGILIRDQYTWATHTHQNENLVAIGFTGLRKGHNNERTYHGLDGEIGLWTQNPQLNGRDWPLRLHLALQWIWNIQILHLGER